MTPDKREFGLPINLRFLAPNQDLILTHEQLEEALHRLRPDLVQLELERISSHLAELADSLSKNRRLPKDVLPTTIKGRVTHVLNGRLLRKQGIWIGLNCSEIDSQESSLQIISLNRGSEDQLPSILGGGRFRRIANRERIEILRQQSQDPVRKFRLH